MRCQVVGPREQCLEDKESLPCRGEGDLGSKAANGREAAPKGVIRL